MHNSVCTPPSRGDRRRVSRRFFFVSGGSGRRKRRAGTASHPLPSRPEVLAAGSVSPAERERCRTKRLLPACFTPHCLHWAGEGPVSRPSVSGPPRQDLVSRAPPPCQSTCFSRLTQGGGSLRASGWLRPRREGVPSARRRRRGGRAPLPRPSLRASRPLPRSHLPAQPAALGQGCCWWATSRPVLLLREAVAALRAPPPGRRCPRP